MVESKARRRARRRSSPAGSAFSAANLPLGPISCAIPSKTEMCARLVARPICEGPRMALTLYHAVPSRSSIVHWMLEEVGQPTISSLSLKTATIAIRTISRSIRWARSRPSITATWSSPRCRRSAPISPTSFHSQAECPDRRRRRGVYLKWMFFGPSCVEPAIRESAFPRKEPAPRSAAGFGDYDSVMDVLAVGTGAAEPYLWASSSPPPTSSSGQACAGA